MELFDAINQRRSVKQYDPNHQMTTQEIEQLLGLAIQSPTSFNLQHWRFVVVQNPELRQKIREVGFDQAQITEASLLVVMCADPNTWEKDPARYWANAPKEVAEMLVGMIHPFHDGREQLQRDEAMRSIGIAMQTIMLAAKAMGYDTCPMIGFEHDKVAEMINLPADHVIGPMIAVGKAVKQPWPKPGQLPLNDVLFYDKFA